MEESNNFLEYKFCDLEIPIRPFFNSPKAKIKEYYVKDTTSSYDDSSSSSSEDNKQDTQLPKIIKWRRAITKDKPAIKHLQTLTGHGANVLYRKRDIDELIEKSCFPIVQLDSSGKLVSFTAYDPYPNIPAISSFVWTEWMSTTYRLQNASSGNVLFIHYMVWQPQQANKFLRLLLETSFTEFIQLKHIIIVKPPKADVPDFYTEYFIPVLPSNLEIINFDSIQTLLVCLRTSIIHPLHIRTALEEEYDIIMPIINGQSTNSKSLNDISALDSFSFLNEEERKALVCEYGRHLTGIMVINRKVDVDFLNEVFELSPFHGLRKRDPDDENIFELPNSTILKSGWKVAEHHNFLKSSDYLLKQMNWELSLNKEKVLDLSTVLDQSSDSSSDISGFSQFSIFECLPVSDEIADEIGSAESKTMSAGTIPHSKNELPGRMADVKVSVRTSISRMPYFCLPKYHGNLNAFMIDFFAFDCNRVDERICSLDFLQAAFRTIPDREYCLLIIPTNTASFPLMELFVRVTPNLLSDHKYELYICHKNSLFSSSMMVRNSEKEDLTAINNFLRMAYNKDEIYNDILNSFIIKENGSQSHVFTVGEEIAGISLIDLRKVGAEDFKMYFDVSNYTVFELHQSENQSIIKYLILNPIYRNQARFFVSELMRLADLTCLYYIYDEHKKEQFNKLTILEEFTPIKPKEKVGIMEEHNHLPVEENLCKLPFSLYIMDRKMSNYWKFQVNTVVVVVGASQTAFSFFESLIFGASGLYVTYHNLIWVSPHELEEESSKPEIEDFMFPVRDNCSRKYRAMVFLKAYVHFVYGVMTEINRSEKFIVVNNKVTLHYDYLILTCGLQYLSPTPKAKEMPKDVHNKNFRSSLARFLFPPESKRINLPKYPGNMFVINTGCDAQTTLFFLEYLMRKIKNVKETNKKIVLYGHDLQVFFTLQVLLKMGIPGELIVFVEPSFPDERSFTIFNDSYVDQAVIESLKNYNVHYYTEYFLYDWSLSSDDFITSLHFHSERKQIVIPCLVFLPFLEKLVSDVTFNACNNAGLVYDGKLVINHNFQTNDRYIYGAGPFTKYARRYYASDQDHQFFSSKEIGQKLADILRSKIDPTFEDKNKYDEESDLVPQMKAPLLCYGQLPGGFNFFFVKKPGKPLGLEVAYNIWNYGDVLTTGTCQMKEGIGYFRIHLDSSGFVEDITCYTKDKIDYVSLSSLYGLHEKLLNNLLLRYDLSLIPDFYEYFSQPWAHAILHENFQILRNRNSMAFDKQLPEMNSGSFTEKLILKLVQNDWKPLPEYVRSALEEEYKNSPIEKEIQKNIMQFIKSHIQDLSLYAIDRLLE